MLYVVFETTTRCLSVYRFARNKTSVSNHPLVFLCLPTKMSDQKKKENVTFLDELVNQPGVLNEALEIIKG